MQTPPPLQLHKSASGHLSKANGAPRYTARSGSQPPGNAPVIAARMIIPVFAAAAAWSSLWIGSLFAGIFALWVCWAIAAAARFLPGNRPDICRQAAFGERIWLNQLTELPKKEGITQFAALYLTAWTGLFVTISGGLFLSPMLTATGLIVSWAAHIVCVQRLASFYHAQKNLHPLYRFWDTKPANDDLIGIISLPEMEKAAADTFSRENQRPSIR